MVTIGLSAAAPDILKHLNGMLSHRQLQTADCGVRVSLR